MKAVILAGGKGTRLGDIAKDTPKSMVKIGQKPLLEHHINLLKREGITDIILCLGHLADCIRAYFGDGSIWGVKITYSIEDKPLGTAGCLKEIDNLLTEDFILISGDVMLDINIKKLVEFHQEQGGICTLAVHPNDHPQDSDLVEVDKGNKIIRFNAKPHDKHEYYENLANASVFVVSPQILRYIKKGVNANFEKDVLAKITTKESLYAYNTAEYIKDMGTPERLDKVTKDFMIGKVNRLNNKHPRKAVFIDRDGVINEEVGFVYKKEQFKLIPRAIEAIKKVNASEYLAIIITNQSAVARNLCSEEDLKEIHKKMETLLGEEGAYIDAIYYCPHHPDQGYPEENPAYKIACECRKPGIGLIKKAVKDFNIGLENSFFVGDSTRDIKTGANARMKTILLKTDYAGKDGKYDIKPDFVFDDLNKAVDFILKTIIL